LGTVGGTRATGQTRKMENHNGSEGGGKVEKKTPKISQY